MKSFILLIVSVILADCSINVAHAQGCDKQTFVTAINQAWVQTNYTQIRSIIDTRLTSCTNDLLGLVLNFGYYEWAEVDFTNAQVSAQIFVDAVSNRAPHEVTDPGIIMDNVKSMAEMDTPLSFPTNQARTTDQIIYLHTREFPSNFPMINLYLDFVSRVETNQ